MFTNHMGSAATNPATASVLPPTTSVVLPSNGATLSGSQYLDAIASPGTSRVVYQLSGNGLTNDVIAVATPTLYGWLAAFDTTTVPNGTYSLQSVATSGGLMGASPAVSVTVDTAAPTTSVVLPSNGATVSGSQYLDATASPGTSQVEYELNGNGLSNDVIATATQTIYGWLAGFDTTTVPNGTYSLQSVATSGGLTGTSPAVTVTVDNAAPTTSVGLPLNGATLSGGQWLDAAASAGVTHVKYLLSGNGLSNYPIAAATTTIVGWLAGFDTTTVPNGIYTLQSVASYTGGVSGTSPAVTVTVSN